jgi:hypothetical protein
MASQSKPQPLLPRFKPVEGSRLSEKDAQIAGEFLSQSSNGRIDSLTAEQVRELARPSTSPIHRLIFKLSDKAAAEEHRLELARHLLRSITIVTIHKGQEMRTPAWRVVTIKSAGQEQKVYTPFENFFKDRSQREEILETARKEMMTFIAKYERYSFLASLISQARVILVGLKNLSKSQPSAAPPP